MLVCQPREVVVIVVSESTTNVGVEEGIGNAGEGRDNSPLKKLTLGKVIVMVTPGKLPPLRSNKSGLEVYTFRPYLGGCSFCHKLFFWLSG